MRKVLNYKKSYQRILRVKSFENFTRNSYFTEATIIPNRATDGDIRKMVLDHENTQRKKSFASKRRNVMYCYWVTKVETITDDRSHLGHENQSSEKEMGVTIPVTYVRGTVMTIREALVKSSNQEFSENTACGLSNLITIDLGLDENNLSDKELDRKVILVYGEGVHEHFFEELNEDSRTDIFKGELLEGVAE